MVKNIAIIGAGGSLGKVLCGLFSKDKFRIIAIDRNENSLIHLYRVYNLRRDDIHIEDIRDFNRIKAIIDHYDIDIVINCAALKHVIWCEYNIKHAIEINIIANLEIMNYLRKKGKKFIFISSDKAIFPQNIYALTKQFTDYITKSHNFKIIRGVNFLYSDGSVLNIWEEQRKRDEPFTVIADKECNRYFISIKQMADLVKLAVEEDSNILEYNSEVVYKVFICDLFKAYLKMNQIFDYKIEEIYLSDNEKVTEDLNFDTKIVELKNIDEIVCLLKKDKNNYE